MERIIVIRSIFNMQRLGQVHLDRIVIIKFDTVAEICFYPLDELEFMLFLFYFFVNIT